MWATSFPILCTVKTLLLGVLKHHHHTLCYSAQGLLCRLLRVMFLNGLLGGCFRHQTSDPYSWKVQSCAFFFSWREGYCFRHIALQSVKEKKRKPYNSSVTPCGSWKLPGRGSNVLWPCFEDYLPRGVRPHMAVITRQLNSFLSPSVLKLCCYPFILQRIPSCSEDCGYAPPTWPSRWACFSLLGRTLSAPVTTVQRLQYSTPAQEKMLNVKSVITHFLLQW